MKRLLFTVISICVLLFPCDSILAFEKEISNPNQSVCKADLKPFLFPEEVDQSNQTKNPIVAKSGCCSWQEGECGCRYGRVLCCNGSLSLTCTCLKAATFAP